MKRFLLLFAVLGLLSCESDKIDDENYRNENYGWFINKKTGKGEWVKLGNQKPDISGDYVVFFSNGNIRETGRILNGEHIDTSIIYDISGNPIKYYFENTDLREHYYLNEGEYKSYYPNGDLMHEGIVKDHKESLPWKAYYESGNLSFHNYKHNDSVVVKLMYYDFGGLKDSVGVLNGKEHGIAKHWYENGVLRHWSYWKNNLQDSLAIIYYQTGEIMEISNWEKNKKEGLTTGYFETGGIAFKYYYKNGLKNGVDSGFFENGNIRAFYTMKNDIKNGLASIFYSNGSKHFEVNYKNGEVDGELRRYGLDGTLRQIEFYSMGKAGDYKVISEFTEKEEEEIKFIQSENDRYRDRTY